MDRFDYAILARVFSHLSYQDLARASTVCRSWLQVVSDERLWKNAYLDVICGNDGSALPDIILPEESLDGHYRTALQKILSKKDHPHSCFVKDCYCFRQIMDSVQSWQMSVSVRQHSQPQGLARVVRHSCVLDRQLNARQSTWVHFHLPQDLREGSWVQTSFSATMGDGTRLPIYNCNLEVSDDDELRVYQAHDSGIYLYRQSPNDASDDGDSDGDRDNDSNSCWKALCFVHFEQILMHSNRIRKSVIPDIDYLKGLDLKLYFDFITSEGATLGGAFVKMSPTHSPDSNNLVWSAQEEAASLPTCAWKKAALLPPSKTPTPTPTPPFSHLNESSWDAVQGVKPSVDTAVELLWKIDSGCMADITLLINDQVLMGRAGIEAWASSTPLHETITLYFLGDGTGERLTENSIKLIPHTTDTLERFQLLMTETTFLSLLERV